MNKTVAILGGGVAGLSAAQELVERGFHVTVYEKGSVPGGKARSMPFKGSGKNGRKDLPGEHGFRFFPRFYRHIIDTMKRIKLDDGRSSVADNLVGAVMEQTTFPKRPPVLSMARFPRSLRDIRVMIKSMRDDLGVPADEAEYFADRFWQFMTSCDERRLAEYERLGWWQYIGAENMSDAYQQYFGLGLTRSTVAARADLASTRTIGQVGEQFFLDTIRPGRSNDNVLDGPTNDVWIDPWIKYLERVAKRTGSFNYNLRSKVTSITCDTKTKRITSVTVQGPNDAEEVVADFFLFAIPVEAMAKLLQSDYHPDNPPRQRYTNVLYADNTLAFILDLAKNVEWMNGIQFYLKNDVKLVEGHTNYMGTPWALSSISQAQFWKNFNFSDYADGTVKGILSVDISDWFSTDDNNQAASKSDPEYIARSTWEQLCQGQNHNGAEVLPPFEQLHSWHLDPDIHYENGSNGRADSEAGGTPVKRQLADSEVLLVNLKATWAKRPQAYTDIENMFLASDYVQTNTDLAT
ncbi:MAG: FAD-dependent oxidoreductase, partial [Rhodothermales bacterium]|nr:FAD-dependent oxidoreductase [Rhodothermales bacterium]